MTSAERTIALSALARQIAVELNKLPHGNTVWAHIEPTEDTYSVYLRNGTDARIYLSFDSYNEPTRLSISGYLHIGKKGSYVEVYERGEDGTGWYKVSPAPSISVAIARGCAAIAKDIAKRFLPEYLRVFALAQTKVQSDADYEATIAANLQRLANVAKVTVREAGQKSFSFSTGESQYHTVAVSANDADLKLDSLTFEQAEHIIRYLRTECLALKNEKTSKGIQQ